MPKIPFWVFILLAAVYFTGVRIDTMDVDASQYAEMSREMMESGNYLHIYDRGMEYLDKPPFLFWVSAVSMEIFGVNNFGFKFPSIIFALLAVFATYRLARLLYDENTGRVAALVLGACQGMFLMTHDIRTDTILMSWVVMALWLIKEWDVHRKLWHLLAGCACISFGMMTKGPVALMIPVFCFATDWILKREWRKFFRPQYLLGIIVIAILLIPMSIGLYQQFDMHPEKVVNNQTGVSGLRFFYWSQSFGRITGESPWNNGAGIDFLLLNMLWSFLPWILIFITALVINVSELVKQRFRLQPHQEWMSTGGFILAYLSLGMSRYQLPHYIFVAFPLAAIMVAKLIKQFYEGQHYQKLYKFFRSTQSVIILLLFVASLLLITVVFPAGVLGIIIWTVCFFGWIYIATRKQLQGKMVWLSAMGILLVNIIINNFIYTSLLDYQLGSQAGRYIHEQSIPADKVHVYKMKDPLNSLHFYAQQVIHTGDADIASLPQGHYVLTGSEGLEEIKAQGYEYDIAKAGDYYKVSELKGNFLNPATRGEATNPYYLLRIK